MVRMEHHGLNLKVRSTGIHTGILRDSCRQKPTWLEYILHSSHTSWRTSLEITWPNLWLPFRLKSSSVFSKIQMIGTECDTGMAFFLVTQRDKTRTFILWHFHSLRDDSYLWWRDRRLIFRWGFWERTSDFENWILMLGIQGWVCPNNNILKIIIIFWNMGFCPSPRLF